jgi:hypothetical protein
VRPERSRPHLPATKAWAPPELRAPRAPRALPAQPGPLGPDCRPSERPRWASTLEELVPLRTYGQPVPLGAAAALLPDAVVLLPDAVELPLAPTQVERPPRGSAHCGLARSEAARPEVTRRVVGGQWAVAVVRLWGPEPRTAVPLQPLGERQILRYTRRSGPGYQPRAPWRDRRDRRWRSSGKSRSYHDPHA